MCFFRTGDPHWGKLSCTPPLHLFFSWPDYICGTGTLLCTEYLVSELSHLEAGVHVFGVADSGNTAKRLHRRSAVQRARSHAYRAVESVLVHLV